MCRRVNPRSIFAALLVAAVALPAVAGFQEPDYEEHWVLLPETPTTRDFIVARHVYSGCGGGGVGARELVFHPDGTIDFYQGDTSDVCDEPFAVDQITDTPLGYLTAGDYTIRFIACGIPYDPEAPDCRPSSREPIQFTVKDAGLPRHTIPVLSDVVKLALATGLALASMALLRIRR